MPELHIPPWTISGPDLKELRLLKSEIFSQDQYYVELDTLQPVIVDLGAHVGMASLYYKKYYPQAQIWAVEPHPVNFEYLVHNLEFNHIEGVTPLQNAIWNETDVTLPLHADADQTWLSTTSILENAWNGDQPSSPVSSEVSTVSLVDLLQLVLTTSQAEQIDVLKIDIEGAEDVVFKDLLAHHPEALEPVQHLFLEHHPFKGAMFTHKLIEKLQELGFKHIAIYKNGKKIPVHLAKGLVMIEASK